jgi:hypothetical protein
MGRIRYQPGERKTRVAPNPSSRDRPRSNLLGLPMPGVGSACIGGGQGIAVVIERV